MPKKSIGEEPDEPLLSSGGDRCALFGVFARRADLPNDTRFAGVLPCVERDLFGVFCDVNGVDGAAVATFLLDVLVIFNQF